MAARTVGAPGTRSAIQRGAIQRGGVQQGGVQRGGAPSPLGAGCIALASWVLLLTSGPSSPSPCAVLQRATYALAVGNVPEAQRLLNLLDEEDGLLVRADCALMLGEGDPALRFLERALRVPGRSPAQRFRLHELAAGVARCADDPARAMGHLVAAAALAPPAARARLALQQLLLAQGVGWERLAFLEQAPWPGPELDRAIARWVRQTRGLPGRAACLLALTALALGRSEPERALALCLEAARDEQLLLEGRADPALAHGLLLGVLLARQGGRENDAYELEARVAALGTPWLGEELRRIKTAIRKR